MIQLAIARHELVYLIPSCQRHAAGAAAGIHTQSEAMSLGSKTNSKSLGYHFQRFQGEGQDDDTQFESVHLLSLEAAEALCSRMKERIPVEVCAP